jgi:hypothetical protein
MNPADKKKVPWVSVFLLATALIMMVISLVERRLDHGLGAFATALCGVPGFLLPPEGAEGKKLAFSVAAVAVQAAAALVATNESAIIAQGFALALYTFVAALDLSTYLASREDE